MASLSSPLFLEQHNTTAFLGEEDKVGWVGPHHHGHAGLELAASVLPVSTGEAIKAVVYSLSGRDVTVCNTHSSRIARKSGQNTLAADLYTQTRCNLGPLIQDKQASQESLDHGQVQLRLEDRRVWVKLGVGQGQRYLA
ncbi:hypothetical protein RRG08_020592 [Elysia crispata]|uniref:Uncharacterized protein n=1 Tax=Elysia crispata TaxID=231223 RepID=A0AAE1A7H7_9GAST|nr:hypothetical protein RRG08_020592 [Elysia crispata]